jgi:hypothetical protein
MMNIDGSILSKLTDDQKKKVEAAQSPEELLALAKEAGYEITPEQLEAVAGGIDWIECPGHGHNCPARCPAI